MCRGKRRCCIVFTEPRFLGGRRKKDDELEPMASKRWREKKNSSQKQTWLWNNAIVLKQEGEKNK